MNEEKIRLPDFLIAELYKGVLVDLDTHDLKPAFLNPKKEAKVPTETIPDNLKIKFLGENGKQVTVLVNQIESNFLSEEYLTFLTTILKACHLHLSDIAIINVAKQEVTYEAIKEQLSPVTILLFDVDPSSIKLPFLVPAFQLQKFDGCTIMVAPPLSLLNKANQEGKLLKTKLWLSLKSVFNLN